MPPVAWQAASGLRYDCVLTHSDFFGSVLTELHHGNV